MAWVAKWTMTRQSLSEKFLGMRSDTHRKQFQSARENAKRNNAVENFDISMNGLEYYYTLTFPTREDLDNFENVQTEKFGDDWDKWLDIVYDDSDLKIVKEVYETS